MSDLTMMRPFADEHVFSWVGRVQRINQASDIACLGVLFGDAWDSSSIVESRINWRWVAERFGDLVGDARFLLENCTWLALQVQLGEISQDLFNSIVKGQTQLSLSDLTFPIASVLKLCPLCYFKDSNQVGVGYWHRSHQSPLVARCLEHRIKLLVFRVGRGGLHTKLPLPSDFGLSYCCASRGFGVVPAVSCLEDFLYSMLTADECRLKEGDVTYTILEELYSLKLVSSCGRVSFRRIEKELSVLLEGRDDITTNAAKKLVWRVIRGVLDQGRTLPLMNLPFLFWLFGSHQTFMRKVDWLKTIGPSSAYFLKENVGATDHDIRDQHRSVCLEFCRGYPSGTRSDFSRKHYRSFHWLKFHDEEFLSRALPIGCDFDLQMKLF